MLELLFGQIPEVLFFTIFMIVIKDFKENNIKYIIINLFLYLILKLFIKYDVKFQALYLFGNYILMKVIYKERIIITDLFLYCFAGLLLIICSLLSFYIFVIYLNFNMIIGAIISKILLFIILFCFKNRIQILYKKYILNWNIKSKLMLSLSARNFALLLMYLIILIISYRLG